MQESSQGKPDMAEVGKAPDGAAAAPAASSGAAVAAASGVARAGPDRGLSSMQHVVELADGLSTIADRLHERILGEIRSYDGRSVPSHVQDAMRRLLDDEMVLRQRANTLYADAAAFVIQGLDQPQSRLVALTAEAAEKIRRIGVIGQVTGLVGGLLSLAGAVASGQPTPVALALEKIHLHSTALDALTPTPPSAMA
ncbi:hypothetical protein [Massilia sp. HP4]|uniref:hypothetical protein n=1 Tax=Massilia sp. HP4 TaxID=2562316 RepID=UPI001E574ED0|nr:hypothetical protein [Massilia sp. HP4]